MEPGFCIETGMRLGVRKYIVKSNFLDIILDWLSVDCDDSQLGHLDERTKQRQQNLYGREDA